MFIGISPRCPVTNELPMKSKPSSLGKVVASTTWRLATKDNIQLLIMGELRMDNVTGEMQ